MNPQDLASLTVYSDVMTVLKERGLSGDEASEILVKLIAQSEGEVVEELMGRLTEEQQATLENIPEGSSAIEELQKLGIDIDEIENIRAQKTAKLIEEMAPQLNDE